MLIVANDEKVSVFRNVNYHASYYRLIIFGVSLYSRFSSFLSSIDPPYNAFLHGSSPKDIFEDKIYLTDILSRKT